MSSWLVDDDSGLNISHQTTNPCQVKHKLVTASSNFLHDLLILLGKIPGIDLSDSLKAEVVDREENGEVVDNNSEKEEEEIPVPCTPSAKRVSFGPYLSPEQFDNTLPPATPIKKGATPRRSTRYSGLKFTRPNIDPVIEEVVGFYLSFLCTSL